MIKPHDRKVSIPSDIVDIKTVFTPKSELNVVSVDPKANLQIMGWNLKESEIQTHLDSYFAQLSQDIKNSFSPLSVLLESMSSGYDPHFLVYKNPQSPII